MIGAMPNMSVEAMLQDWTQISGKTRKEAMKIMEFLYNTALKEEQGRGFLVIYPQRLWGSGRVQIGSLWSTIFPDLSISDGNIQ